MSRFRFSLTTFLVVVTLVAIGLAAMTSQSPLVTSLAYTAFVVLLCLASVGAFVAAADKRPFWLGFAIFGWTYWFAEFDTSRAQSAPQPQVVGSFAFFMPSRTATTSPAPPVSLVTEGLMNWLESQVSARLMVGSKVSAQYRGGAYYSGTITDTSGGQYLIVWDDGSPQQWTPASQILPNSPNLRVAAHATLGGLFALFGGALATIVFGRPKENGKPIL
jgi:hypothetical protein